MKQRLVIALVYDHKLTSAISLRRGSGVSLIAHGNGSDVCELIGTDETLLLSICTRARIRTFEAHARFQHEDRISIFADCALSELLKGLDTAFELTVLEMKINPRQC